MFWTNSKKLEKYIRFKNMHLQIIRKKHTHTQHVSKSWKSRDWSHNILMAILFLFMGLGFIYVVNPITVLMKSPFHTKSRSKHREPPLLPFFMALYQMFIAIYFSTPKHNTCNSGQFKIVPWKSIIFIYWPFWRTLYFGDI
jgi:uncharacterized BrkB/YihY/UPF0761 family membrane protein